MRARRRRERTRNRDIARTLGARQRDDLMATEYNYEHALRCLSDAFTPVRDLDGALIGAIPKAPDDNGVTVRGTNGQNFELRIGMQVCGCVDVRTQNPSV